jgi:hypothetical protein
MRNTMTLQVTIAQLFKNYPWQAAEKDGSYTWRGRRSRKEHGIT